MQGEKSKRSSPAKNFTFTVNNYNEEKIAIVENGYDSGKCSYLLYGFELGLNNTPHLQGYVQFASKIRYESINKTLKAHFEVAKGTPLQNKIYCTKDDKYKEFGTIDPGAGVKEKLRGEQARSAAKEGKFDDIPADIYIRYHGNLHRIHQDSMPTPSDRPTLDNLGVGGPTGIGKSKWVRDTYGTVYNKPKNKGWDGYDGTSTVLIEEIQPCDAEWIASFLKVGADHYSFIGEMKGRSISLRPPTIIVTSNYSIERLFKEPEDYEPLLRRFKIHEFKTLITNKN